LREAGAQSMPACRATPQPHVVGSVKSVGISWVPPSLAGQHVLAQPHCHHNFVMNWGPDAQLLRSAGANVTRLGGCCGLAGNFGVEKGHYEVSVAVAEQQLLPAVRQAATDTTVLADGYSCRTQLADLTDRTGVHLSQLFSQRLSHSPAAENVSPRGCS
jgi:Fe-S oxidoreductase